MLFRPYTKKAKAERKRFLIQRRQDYMDEIRRLCLRAKVVRDEIKEIDKEMRRL